MKTYEEIFDECFANDFEANKKRVLSRLSPSEERRSRYLKTSPIGEASGSNGISSTTI